MESIISYNTSPTPKHSFLDLPDYLVETYIFPYLNSQDLFYTVRAVTPEWHDMMKNAWGGNIKDEMFNQIRKLSFIYEKDALTKTYEFKVQYLINYRNLLTIFTLNTDILNIVYQSIELVETEEQVRKLLKVFFTVFQMEDETDVMTNITDENCPVALRELLEMPEKDEQFKNTVELILDIENIYTNEEQLHLIQNEFNELNKVYLENVSEHCRMIYSFLQGLIEYQLLKINVQELKEKVDNLFIAIQKETQLWPKRKKFFETAYKILLFSKSSNYRINKMIKVFAEFKVKSPLLYYREESFRMINELKENIEHKKNEIIYKQQLQLQQDQQQQQQNATSESIDEMFLTHLLNRRLLLTKKLILFEKFYYMFSLCKYDNVNQTCVLKDTTFPIKHFLITLIIASQSYEENFNEDTLIQIKQIIEEKYSFNLQHLFYSDEELQKQKEIQLLKQEKENLLLQKHQTEQVLYVLKKYLLLKETLTNNKKKYKLILYLLSKIRKGEANATDKKSITDVLMDLNVENVDFECEDISEQEKKELENFESSGKLLQEIENTLMKQISAFFIDEHKKTDDNGVRKYEGNEVVIQNNEVVFEMICGNDKDKMNDNNEEEGDMDGCGFNEDNGFLRNNIIQSMSISYSWNKRYSDKELEIVKVEELVIEPQVMWEENDNNDNDNEDGNEIGNENDDNQDNEI